MKAAALCIFLILTHFSSYATAAPAISYPDLSVISNHANGTELLSFLGGNNPSSERVSEPPNTPFWHIILSGNVRLKFWSTVRRWDIDIGEVDMIQATINGVEFYQTHFPLWNPRRIIGPLFGGPAQNLQPPGRNVQMRADLEFADFDMTWEMIIECLKFAKVFASTYPGWDFNFDIFEGLERSGKLLGRFTMQTKLIPGLFRRSSLLTAVNTNTTGFLQLLGSNDSLPADPDYGRPPETPFWHIIPSANVRLGFDHSSQVWSNDIGKMALIQQCIDRNIQNKNLYGPRPPKELGWTEWSVGDKVWIGEQGRPNRQVQMTAGIDTADKGLSWDIINACLEFAKSFASSYPGWNFSFTISELKIRRMGKYLGKFNLETSRVVPGVRAPALIAL